MSSTATKLAKWAGKKAVGAVAAQLRERAARGTCAAEPRKQGVACNRPLVTGRRADGLTCGRTECGLWLVAHDPQNTLGISPQELAAELGLCGHGRKPAACKACRPVGAR